MAAPALLYPNYIDDTFYSVVIGGGDWSNNSGLSNLTLPSFSDVARSNGVADADLEFFIDLGGTRGISGFAIPFHNLSLAADYRVRGSNTPKFSGATVSGPASGGATSFTLQAGSSAVNLSAGEIISFGSDATIYQITADANISASATGSVSIKQDGVTPAAGLVNALSGGEAVNCHSGDFSSPDYDTGQIDAFQIIYPFGSIDYTHPSWWTGLPTEEQRAAGKFPLAKVFDLAICRYWQFNFYDSSNADSYVEIPRLYLSPVVQPSIGASYGAQHDFETDTQVDLTLSGRKIYNRLPIIRRFSFQLEHLTVEEQMTGTFDLQTSAGIDKQMFFLFDPDDTALLHRRSFAATLGRLSAMSYPYFKNMNSAYELEEVVA